MLYKPSALQKQGLPILEKAAKTVFSTQNRSPRAPQSIWVIMLGDTKSLLPCDMVQQVHKAINYFLYKVFCENAFENLVLKVDICPDYEH